jgi:FXSXX-COOH protein
VDTEFDLTAALNSGIADVRRVPLSQIARDQDGGAAAVNRRIIPGAGCDRVVVAAFGSSI